MAGYDLVLKVKRLEDTLHKMGMRWGHDKHGGQWGGEYGDRVGVFPRDEELPVYARDAMLFSGTIDQLQVWITGIEWARGYDMINKVSDDKKRARKEQDRRNENLLLRVKGEKVVGKGHV
jgi:hypothetical protein